MPRTKIAITLSEDSLRAVDRLVRERRYPNRSQAIQAALDEALRRQSRSRLERECALLEPEHEQTLADQGLREDLEAWPVY